MNPRQRMVVLCLAVLVALSGCGGDAQVGSYTLASSVDQRGKADHQATAFKPGDTVYASVELTDGYKGLELTATWRRGEEQVSEETVATPHAAETLNPLYVVFRLETEPGWPPGGYTCEIFVPDQGKTMLAFTLDQ